MDPTLPGMAPNPAPMPPVAGNAPAQSAGALSAQSSASATAPLFGGLRGGRPRKDGLKPGSTEALAADREKDRLRKQAQRVRESAAQPPPLPSAPTVPGAIPAPPGNLAGLPGAQGLPVMAWQPEMLKPIFEQLIPACEEVATDGIINRAIKARLPKECIKEIEIDAKWNAPAKKAIEISGPQVAAKWLNKSGLSAENQGEIVLLTAISSLVASHALLANRLNKLIILANTPAAGQGNGLKSEEKKAP
jgi:hypothetical protein